MTVIVLMPVSSSCPPASFNSSKNMKPFMRSIYVWLLCLIPRSSLPNRNSLLHSTVSVSMLITFLSSECVGQRAAKWLWAECVHLHARALMCVKLYLYIEFSPCIRFQRVCVRLFTLCTFCLSAALLSCVSPFAVLFFWQLLWNEDAFLMRLWGFCTYYNNKWSLSSPCLFLSLLPDNGWSIWHNHMEKWNCLDRRGHQETMHRNPKII